MLPAGVEKERSVVGEGRGQERLPEEGLRAGLRAAPSSWKEQLGQQRGASGSSERQA